MLPEWKTKVIFTFFLVQIKNLKKIGREYILPNEIIKKVILTPPSSTSEFQLLVKNHNTPVSMENHESILEILNDNFEYADRKMRS